MEDVPSHPRDFSHTQPVLDDRTMSKDFRLLDLPAEIRNLIYQYAVVHDQNQGFIAPIATGKKEILLSGFPDVDAIVNGEPVRIYCEGNVAQLISFPTPSWGALSLFTERHDLDFDHVTHLANGGSKEDMCGYIMDNDEIKTTFMAHVCTSQCLLQPAITRVNRQIREETLSVFYGSNKFHLNLDCQGSGRSAFKTAVTAWWRAIEDTNLRRINDLSIKGANDSALALKLSWRIKHVGERLTVDLDPVDPPDIAQIEREASEAREQIEAGGLFVRGIERILSVSGVLDERRSVAW